MGVGVRGAVYMGGYTGVYGVGYMAGGTWRGCPGLSWPVPAVLFPVFLRCFFRGVVTGVLPCFTGFYRVLRVLRVFTGFTSPVITSVFTVTRLRIALSGCTSFTRKDEKTEPARNVHASAND